MARRTWAQRFHPQKRIAEMNSYVSYFRPEIDSMTGYTPGEQPKGVPVIKLNTNENPYPPSPGVKKTLASFQYEKLRLYPDPLALEVRAEIAAMTGFSVNNIIAGNGSDDILTIATRCFSDARRPMACFEPSYSLYPTLAGLQGTPCIWISRSRMIRSSRRGMQIFLLSHARMHRPEICFRRRKWKKSARNSTESS